MMIHTQINRLKDFSRSRKLIAKLLLVVASVAGVVFFKTNNLIILVATFFFGGLACHAWVASQKAIDEVLELNKTLNR